MIGKYDPLVLEPEILNFWVENSVYEKAKDQNVGKKKYYFLDGPPYTSGKVHVGTAWNKSLKDSVLRYKRMTHKFDVWDRAGYDMHGLPTEHATQKKLKIENKEEIEKYGIGKFVTECKQLCIDNMKIMNEDFLRMGVWMDFENAYQSVKDSFIEGEWWLIKKAHENKRLYEGQRTMTWCASCQTALAKHELEYKVVKEDSIFLKFKINNDKNEFLIVWTTTPWTIPFNLAVMVNPKLDYVRCDVEGETWILAKALAGPVVQMVANKTLNIVEEFKGETLEGLEYSPPFMGDFKYLDEIKKESPKAFTVLLSNEYVDTTAGSGLVHCAPGCGPEDYEVGHRNGIKPFNNLDESGVFPDDMGPCSSLTAKKDDKKFIKVLKEKGNLIETTEVEHDYAHCWRCHEPIIYKTTVQWFFKVEDIKKDMIKANNSVKWVPDAAYRAFNSWLENLRDNSITKQRFWGTPLPVWKCSECSEYDVIGSVDELKKLSGQEVKELHKPEIDKITIPCKCGQKKNRIPDILDVWVDAGTVSWNCLDFPKKDELFNEMFPADFILEGKDQIRGWFNLLLIASMVSMKKPSYKQVYMHGFVNDIKGRKMSKSLGNYILPQEVIDKYGADTLRYYMIGGANPGIDINYNFEDMKVKFRNLGILWNLHKFLIDYSSEIGVNPLDLKDDIIKDFSVEENYIFSKMNSCILRITECFDNYKINETPWIAEELFLELSRTYIQLVRDKSSIGTIEEKKVVLYTVYNVMLNALKIFNPVAPFISEMIYQNLKKEFGLVEESVNLLEWPKAEQKIVDQKLEQDMDIVQGVIASTLGVRDKVQLGVRWPLSEVYIATTKEEVVSAVENLMEIIKKQTNVRDVKISSQLEGVVETVKGHFGKLGPAFGTQAPKIVACLASVSPGKILKSIREKGKYELLVDGEKFDILAEHLNIEKKVPEPYVEAEARGCSVYLNVKLDSELEAEGYSREVMRRIQSERKNAGLQKSDIINLYLEVDEKLQLQLKDWAKQIKEKVGAKSYEVSTTKPKKPYEFKNKYKIKDYEIWVYFNKV